MKETAIEKNEIIEKEAIVEQAEAAKPYTLRKLTTKDVFHMTKILGKIGIKEFKHCFEGEAAEKLIAQFKESKTDKALMSIGVAIGFEGIDIVVGNLHKCENDIYDLLSSVSGLSVQSIEEDPVLFMEMLIDFFKKPEFPAFIKVVSRLF